MTIKPYLVQQAISEYDHRTRQGRQLARIKKILREDTVSISPEAKRKFMVQQVATEVIENLLPSKSNHPIVKEIMQELEKEFQEKFTFKVEPDSGDHRLQLNVYQKDSLLKLPPARAKQVLQRLWEITINKIDQTML